MGFWIGALALAALVGLYVARPLALSRRGARSRAAHDEQVFRDQLVEIDKDRERGVLSSEEAEAARIEVSRRLLAAAAEREAAPDHAPAPRVASLALAGALLVGAPLGGWAIYSAIGAPGLPDQPLSARLGGERPGQALAERRAPAPPEPAEEAGPALDAIAEAQARLEEAPENGRALFVLAQANAQIGRYGEAWRAYERLIESTQGDAPAAIWTAKAESMILAAGGYVSPEAEAAIRAALDRSPADPVARLYLGELYAQTGRPQSAVETWTTLAAESPAEAPWREAAIRSARTVAAEAGLPEPTIPAPAEPDPEESRAQMTALVERLAERVAAEGGTPEDWAQLVRSWRVLEEDARAEAAAAQARAALSGEDLAAFEALLEETPPEPPHDAQDPSAAVAALDARLSAEGGTAAAWLRLVNSYAALGDADAARAALARARAALAEDAGQLAALEGALSGATFGGALGPGPSAEEVEAAGEMAPEDRRAMIEGMVSGLRDRLFEEGGSPGEWARLVRAEVVMGDRAAASEAYARAMDAHGRNDAAAAMLRETARGLGVAGE